MEPWKLRPIAEYAELKDRHEKLCAMLGKLSAGTLEFTPDCPAELLRKQERAMELYLQCLEERALYEKVTLPK